MKEIFCKIIELETHQVLIEKEYEMDNEGDFNVRQTTYIEGVRPSMSIGFDSEEKANHCFDNYDAESAKAFVGSMNDLING